jgi:hypothetical protein
VIIHLNIVIECAQLRDQSTFRLVRGPWTVCACKGVVVCDVSEID